MTDEEIIAFLFLMVVAGNETTTKLLGNALFHLTAPPRPARRGLRRPDGRPGRAVDRGDAALRHLEPAARPAPLEDVDAARRRRAGRLQAAARARLGQPRRPGLHRPGPLRHPPRQGRAAPDPQLRRRPALLPRRQPGPARGAGRAARAGPPGRHGRGRPRRAACGSTRQRARLRARCRCGWRCADEQVRAAGPPARRRHRRLVRHRRGDGAGARRAAATRSRSAPAAPTGATRSRPQIRDAGGEAVVHPLDLDRRPSPSPTFATAVAADLGDDRGRRLQRRLRRSPARSTRSTPSGSRARSTSTCSARTGWSARSCPAWSSAQRGDVVFVSSDVAVRARPFMSAYAASKWGLEGMAHALQMELEGTGVRASHRAARADLERDGQRLGRRATPPSCSTSGCASGSPGTRTSSSPTALADAIATIVTAPRGVHLNLIEVDPRSTRGGPMTDSLRDSTRSPRSRTPSPTTRTATCRSCAPTRSACFTGCATSAATSAASGWPTRTSCWSAAPRPTRQFFRAPDEVLDQAAAYPFMTPIFGKGVVFDASPEERQQMLEEPGAARRHDARPRRDHRGARSTGWSPTGATRARSTCSTGSPS